MNPEIELTDIHIHFCAAERLSEFMDFCDMVGIKRAGLVSLPDLKRGNFNNAVLAAVKSSPHRFTGFGCLDHRLSRTEAGGAEQVKQLSLSGFTGLKLWLGKPEIEQAFDLRMEDNYISGALKAASELGMPVLMHLADPPDFWNPASNGGLNLSGTFESWIERGQVLFSRFPDIRFIGAHLLFLAGGLKNLDTIMSEHKNLYLDTAPGRWFYRPLSEQKAAASNFFIRRSDRILLGSDSMFFPKDFNSFKPAGIKENSVVFERILKFISGGQSPGMTIDDPYPWDDYDNEKYAAGGRKLPCLDLDRSTIRKITGTNAAKIFKGETE